MNMNDTKVVKRKELRGKIVSILYDEVRAPLRISTIINALARQWTNADTEVITQMYYLSDAAKGYVRVTDEDGRVTQEIAPDGYARLTAVGCNLCEGDVEDPGVIFGDAERL